MNRYLSTERWKKVRTGAYRGPDGYVAIKRGASWVLFSRKHPPRAYAALADCQEWVAEQDALEELAPRPLRE